MNIINKLKTKLFGNTIETHEVPEYVQTEQTVFQQKVKDVYGEDKLAQQKLYEKWSVKEHWNLKAEAIPVIMGYDPMTIEWKKDEALQKKMVELFQHAEHCIKQGMSLSVVDSGQNPDDWEVVPTEFYCWASVSRVDVPQQLSTLMEFVLSTIKQTTFVTDDKSAEPSSPEAANLSQNFNQQAEMILGASLVLLAKYPQECRDSKGKVKATNIVQLINKHQDAWFKDKNLDLSNSAKEDLINKWLSSLS